MPAEIELERLMTMQLLAGVAKLLAVYGTVESEKQRSPGAVHQHLRLRLGRSLKCCWRVAP
jgi:hypothetical protein